MRWSVYIPYVAYFFQKHVKMRRAGSFKNIPPFISTSITAEVTGGWKKYFKPLKEYEGEDEQRGQRASGVSVTVESALLPKKDSINEGLWLATRGAECYCRY